MVSAGMTTQTYSVKCPKCSEEAAAKMRPVGIGGGYREPTFKMGAAWITCSSCGLSHEVPPEKAEAYELWYVTSFKGHRLWARNRRHLTFLIAWFSGELSKADLGIGDRDTVEGFQKWMTLAKNRPGILNSLYRLAAMSTSRPVRRTWSRRSRHSSSRQPSAPRPAR